MLTQNRLKELFIYDSLTGSLRRRKLIGKQKNWYPWRNLKDTGYFICEIDGRTEYLHRMIFLYHNGFLPPNVDHRNTCKQDNRKENLRVSTFQENCRNRGKTVKNSSGFKGVVFHKYCSGKPWHAKIAIKGKVISGGYHSDIEDAARAHDRLAVEYFGEFAITNFPQV